MSTTTKSQYTIDELLAAIEPMVRRVVREEIDKAIRTFYLTPDMPLYDDLVEIGDRKAKGLINLKTHDEVWGE